MKQAIILIILWTGLLALPAMSQHGFGKSGTTEISGGISFASITPISNGKSEDGITLLSFGPEIGYFITDGFEVGFNPGVSLLPGLSVVTPSKGDGVTIAQLFAVPAYNFLTETGRVTPFISVPFGYTAASSGNQTQSGFSWGVRGGMKVVAAGNLLVTCYGEYFMLSFTPEKATERYGFDFLSFGVSVGGFF